MRVEEDTTYDSETQRLQAEAVHYLVFAGSGGLRARAWGSSDEVRRYYHFGGQRVAMRVSGASSSQNGVYYLHPDHLGSTTLVTTGEWRWVGAPLGAGSVWMRQLYEPYGAVRYATNPHGPAPTDYGYTGQRATDLGLMDYRARWYAPALGRFVSADTLVPGAGGQALNRYMYVGGNPLGFSDPTGHWMNQVVHDSWGNAPALPPLYGIVFTAAEGQFWDARDKAAILEAAGAIGQALVEAVTGTERWDLLGEPTPDPETLFREVYGTTTFYQSNESRSYWAEVAGSTVTIYANAPTNTDPNIHYTFYNACHELGHVFDNRTGRTARGQLASEGISYTDATGRSVPIAGGVQNYLRVNAGYASPGLPWQQNNVTEWGGISAGEDFADMFLGWSYNHFAPDAAGAARYQWMSDHMSVWIALAVAGPAR